MSNLLIRRSCNEWHMKCERLKSFRILLSRQLSEMNGERKRLSPCQHWLQRNRIDGRDGCLSVGVMNQIILQKQETPSTPIHCQFCGGLMRLIGSEPHPVEDNLDLLTYVCSACNEFAVSSIESPPIMLTTGDALTREGKAFRHRSVLSVLIR